MRQQCDANSERLDLRYTLIDTASYAAPVQIERKRETANPTADDYNIHPSLLGLRKRSLPSGADGQRNNRRRFEEEVHSPTPKTNLRARLGLLLGGHLGFQLLRRQPHDVLVLVRVEVVLAGIELLEPELAGQHVALPFLVLVFVGVELGHHLLGEQL